MVRFPEANCERKPSDCGAAENMKTSGKQGSLPNAVHHLRLERIQRLFLGPKIRIKLIEQVFSHHSGAGMCWLWT